MPIIPVPAPAGRTIWTERHNPDIAIVLDNWDTDHKRYGFHDLDDPDITGTITPATLDAAYRPSIPNAR